MEQFEILKLPQQKENNQEEKEIELDLEIDLEEIILQTRFKDDENDILLSTTLQHFELKNSLLQMRIISIASIQDDQTFKLLSLRNIQFDPKQLIDIDEKTLASMFSFFFLSFFFSFFLFFFSFKFSNDYL